MKKLDIEMKLLILKYKTRWSSTFATVKSAYPTRKVLSAVIHRIHDIADLLVSEPEGNACDKIHALLKHKAGETEFIFEQTKLLLSAVERVTSKLRWKRNHTIVEGEHMLIVMAEWMKMKLPAYKEKVCMRSAGLAGI